MTRCKGEEKERAQRLRRPRGHDEMLVSDKNEPKKPKTDHNLVFSSYLFRTTLCDFSR
jgi:hypothetical protein